MTHTNANPALATYLALAASPSHSLRNRDYSPTLGRWMAQDPAGYVDGGSLYQAYESGPVGAVDPWGLQSLLLPSPSRPTGSGSLEPPPGSSNHQPPVQMAGSPFLPNPDYRLPGWDPSWPTGLDNRGPYVQDPSGGKWYPHNEDPRHWPHYDNEDNNTRFPQNSNKPRPGQKVKPYGEQSGGNPWETTEGGKNAVENAKKKRPTSSDEPSGEGEGTKMAVIGIGAYLFVKWGIAILAAPETCGVSLVGACATP